ncbi:MAG TPA: hypothetical protein VIM35_06590 [Gallionella sp.]
MKHLQKHFSASLIALAALLAASPMAMAAPASSLSTFAILSAAPGLGGAVTLTDSLINGDVGSSGLKASVTNTRSVINGAIIAPVDASVVTEFNTALQAGLALQCDNATILTGTLDGQLLSPGTYCVSAEAKTGTLTLDGSATDSWTFIVAANASGGVDANGNAITGALTGTNFNVVMKDGSVVPCDGVTWYVAQAATLTTSNFVGTIYAGAAITITSDASPGVPASTSFNGDALAGAAVTTTGATVNGCTPIKGHHHKAKCNQGVGNGTEGCDPGNSNNNQVSNDEVVNGEAGVPGDPNRQPDTSTSVSPF